MILQHSIVKGNDIGTQYRSVYFYLDKTQKQSAELSKSEIGKSNLWAGPIVTVIEQLIQFYPAEDYHHDYYKSNPDQAYCRFVIEPKTEKNYLRNNELLVKRKDINKSPSIRLNDGLFYSRYISCYYSRITLYGNAHTEV